MYNEHRVSHRDGCCRRSGDADLVKASSCNCTQHSNEDHIYAMGKKTDKQSRSVTVETTGGSDSQAASPQTGVDELTTKLRQRDDELAEAQQRLAAMEQILQASDSNLALLQTEVSRLRAALKQGGGTAPVPVTVTKPEMHDVVDQLPKHATLRYATRPLSQITHLCIHHSATAGTIPLENVAKYHVEERGWAGIGYHFYVKPDGTVYQTNRLETVSYQVSQNNDYSVGVCVSGDFTYAPPPDKQVDAAASLVAWLMQELSVSDQNVLGHKEFPNNDTSCPGETWLKKQCWKNTLVDRVRALRVSNLGGGQVGRIGHYVLFWQKPDAWAQQDWKAAETYFGRFRPTAGFSVDDAQAAQFVTIVGGPAGVPPEAEQQLRAAGCQVERLAGVDYADTKRILDALAETGRRFQNFAG